MTGMLLQAHDLRVSLPSDGGWVDALRGVSISMAPGQTLGVVGESGSGKSMLALALMGLLPEGARVQGSLRFDGQELIGQPEVQRRRLRGDRMAMIFQEPMSALNPVHPIGRQVGESLRVHRGLDARSARAQALRLLDAVRLPQAAQRLDAYPHQLSGGQRQRVMIAMALACEPDLLIADEPTTALDVTLQRDILTLIAEVVADRGMALLLISHDLGVIARQVQQLMVMYGGYGVEAGPTADVLRAPAHPYTMGLLAARPRLGADRTQRLVTIPGQVPELTDLPTGCAFAPRCAWRQARCETALPSEQATSAEAWVRCVRWPVPAAAQQGQPSG